MGVTGGLCGVNEFLDVVSGICGQCSDICRDIARPDSFCLYHCSDYYSRLLSTTVKALQEHTPPITLIVLTPVLVVVVFCVMVVVFVITCWRLCTNLCIRKRYEFPGRRNAERKFTVGKFRHRRRTNRHVNVQETRDPSKQEDVQLSVLCMSPCSSLVQATESSAEEMRFKALVHDQLYRKKGGSTHQVTVNAVISPRDRSCSGELEETQPKVACDIESMSSPPLVKREVTAEREKNSSNDERTHASRTSRIHSTQDNRT